MTGYEYQSSLWWGPVDHICSLVQCDYFLSTNKRESKIKKKIDLENIDIRKFSVCICNGVQVKFAQLNVFDDLKCYFH